MAQYEIGMVYRSVDKYYLAVDRNLILRGEEGKVDCLECSDRFERAKSVSVAMLCRSWGISTAELDVLAHAYLSPLPRPGDALVAAGVTEEANKWSEPTSFGMAS